MAVFVAVYHRHTLPVCSELLQYLGNIESHSGEEFNAEVHEAEIRGSYYPAVLFRVNDQKRHDDALHILLLKGIEPEEGDEVGLTRYMTFLNAELPMWSQYMNLEDVDMYLTTSGCRVITFKGDTSRLNDIFVQGKRGMFTLIKE
jgi:hypothetical protein